MLTRSVQKGLKQEEELKLNHITSFTSGKLTRTGSTLVDYYDYMCRFATHEKAICIVNMTSFTYYYEEERDMEKETVFKAVCDQLTIQEKIEIKTVIPYWISERYGTLDASTENLLHARALSFLAETE